jgi:hypothetical protein
MLAAKQECDMPHSMMDGYFLDRTKADQVRRQSSAIKAGDFLP